MCSDSGEQHSRPIVRCVGAKPRVRNCVLGIAPSCLVTTPPCRRPVSRPAPHASAHLPFPRCPFPRIAIIPQPLLAVGGASGIIIGLATQQVLGNFVSGLNIFLAR